MLGGPHHEGWCQERKVAVEVGWIRIFLSVAPRLFDVCHHEGLSPGMFVRMAINGMDIIQKEITCDCVIGG